MMKAHIDQKIVTPKSQIIPKPELFAGDSAVPIKAGDSAVQAHSHSKGAFD
jgi:hypothetical protein